MCLYLCPVANSILVIFVPFHRFGKTSDARLPLEKKREQKNGGACDIGRGDSNTRA